MGVESGRSSGVPDRNVETPTTGGCSDGKALSHSSCRERVRLRGTMDTACWVSCDFVQSVRGGVEVPNRSVTRLLLVSSVVGLLFLFVGSAASAIRPSHSHKSVGRILFTHVAPDGSRVVARTATCT